MATKSPRMTGADRREQLLDVTKAIVAGDGFHAVSIERVAREAGITRPVVYGHFGDLDGLLEALIDRETVRSISQLDDVIEYDLGRGRPGRDPAGLAARLPRGGQRATPTPGGWC